MSLQTGTIIGNEGLSPRLVRMLLDFRSNNSSMVRQY
jgi:hypothetical protein